MWKHIVETDRPQMARRQMRIVYRIPKSINTHSENHLCYFFTAKILARTRRNITLDVHCLSCLIIEINISYWVKFKCVLVLN
jgi:hypothetical protein